MITPARTLPLRSGLLGALQLALAALLRVLLFAAAFIFMLAALLAGAVLALGVVVWALLRGRRPAPGILHAYYQRARRRQRPGDERVVVDVQAVEVPAARLDDARPRA